MASPGYVEVVAFLNVEDLLSNSHSPSEVGSDVFLCGTGFRILKFFRQTHVWPLQYKNGLHMASDAGVNEKCRFLFLLQNCLFNFFFIKNIFAQWNILHTTLAL